MKLDLRGAWNWATRNMIDRMLVTGIAIGALPLFLRGSAWFHTSLSAWQMLLVGLALGYALVWYMSDVFGKYSFMFMQRLVPGSMKEMNLRNMVISLFMLWLGSFTFLGLVTVVFGFVFGWLTAGSITAVAIASVIIGACYALTHHQNHNDS